MPEPRQPTITDPVGPAGEPVAEVQHATRTRWRWATRSIALRELVSPTGQVVRVEVPLLEAVPDGDSQEPERCGPRWSSKRAQQCRLRGTSEDEGGEPHERLPTGRPKVSQPSPPRS